MTFGADRGLQSSLDCTGASKVVEVSRCIFTPVVRHSACLLTGPKCFLPGSPRRDLALRGCFHNQSRSPPRWRLAGGLWETQASSPEDATKENQCKKSEGFVRPVLPLDPPGPSHLFGAMQFSGNLDRVSSLSTTNLAHSAAGATVRQVRRIARRRGGA